ncbi:MAG TPA: VacJ family lipoprotein [Candidatus Limnocylindrales bacterium]|nr:VacJ family lipoprotein [Candidatus Limnocylindrales bacterium]
MTHSGSERRIRCTAAAALFLLSAAHGAIAAEHPAASGPSAKQAAPATSHESAPATANDPWMRMNRSIFRFNDALDRYALEPVARGYDFVTPDLVQGWVTNFFHNLWFPVTFTNCVLQAKPHEATQTLARFIINTTAGIGGFGDPATKLHVPAPVEDFGQTLGYWGVKPGPFVMLPLFGPSTVRDTFGRAADSATRVWPFFVSWWVSTPAGVTEVINTRARYADDIEDLRESSVDFYASVRNAYLQRRAALVADRVGKENDQATEQDLYFPEEE